MSLPRGGAATAHAETRPARRNLSRRRAREALRVVRKQELEARQANPEARKLVRQQVCNSFFHQIFGSTTPRR